MCFDKKILRKEMIERRKSEGRSENGLRIAEKIKNLSEFRAAKTVMIYMPIKGEADVTSLLNEDKKFLLPVTEGEDMYASVFKKELDKGAFGVYEPREREEFKGRVDVVVVPGVAFDRKGGRIGFGKGYYDRFLSGRDCFKIGVCHSFQLVDEICGEEHDVKMDMIITEDEAIWIRENTSSD
jgi:5-formyltetrahydrofolate cyclo-ligase